MIIQAGKHYDIITKMNLETYNELILLRTLIKKEAQQPPFYPTLLKLTNRLNQNDQAASLWPKRQQNHVPFFLVHQHKHIPQQGLLILS